MAAVAAAAAAAVTPAITPQMKAYLMASPKPMPHFQVNEPMIATALSAAGIGWFLLSKLAAHTNYWTIALALLPAYKHGTKLFTRWLPDLVWRLPKGEATRIWTNNPDVSQGLPGWFWDARHSNHFSLELAEALVGLAQTRGANTHADFECAGDDRYARAMRNGGVDSQGYDFSFASVRAHANDIIGDPRDSTRPDRRLKLATLGKKTPMKYKMVTSFEALSKTLFGEEEAFVRQLVDATEPDGIIIMSCAAPGQAGPNSNCLSKDAVIGLFGKLGWGYNPGPTMKLRNAAGMYPWLRRNILVFTKTVTPPH